MWTFGSNYTRQLGTGNETNFNVPQKNLDPPVLSVSLDMLANWSSQQIQIYGHLEIMITDHTFRKYQLEIIHYFKTTRRNIFVWI